MGQNKIEDIGPVEERKWYDGFLQLGDSITQVAQKEQAKASDWIGAAAKTILGTNTDILTNLVSGVVGWGEDVVDAGASLAGILTETFGWDSATQNIRDFVKKDLYDEQEITRNLFKTGALTNAFAATNPGLAFAIPTMFTIEEWLNPTKSLDDGFGGIENIKDDNSVLGETSKGILQSTGETLAKQGIQMSTGIPVGDIITGVTVFGSQAEQALKEDANFMQAGGSGLISAAAEIMFEKLSGGIKISGHTLDEGLTKLMSRSISNVALRNFLNFAKDIGGEAIEEAATEFVDKLGTLLYKDRDQWDEILFSKDALVDYIQSAISGGLMGGAFNAANAVNSTKKGVDYKSGLTNDEQKVVDKVAENAIKQKETDGKKLSEKEKNLLYNDILKQLEDGDISITDIEDALGEEVFKDYSDTIKYEEDILKQYEELGKKKNYTLAEASLFEELKSQKKDIEQNSPREELKKQMSEKVFERVKDSKLMNSYANEARRGETFQADVNEYDEAERATIQSAIDAGFLNNTNKTRRFVNWVAKIAAKTGIKVDFTTIEKLKESGFAVDGKFVNGYKTKDGIGINMQSKKILETVVGHEITHVLEGTELYNEMQKALFDYAKSKGELETRRKAMKELYKNMDADIDSELTAELVGDYLFTDQEFINRLANDNRTLFQKIWDEIKYMWKQAHPSSPEAQKLEKLKRAFEEAYKTVKSRTVTENGIQYAIADTKDITPSKEKVDSNIQEVASMDSVYTIDESKLSNSGKTLMDTYGDYFSQWGGNIKSALFGDVAVRRSSIRSEIRHGSTAEKIASIEAIPSVIQNGKIVDWLEKEKGVYRIVVAAPISIGNSPCIMGVMLQRDSQNQRLYLHDVVIEKEATDSLQDNLITTGSHKESDSLYTTMILQKVIDVKRNLKNSAKNDISVSDGTQLSLSTDTESRKQEQFAIIQENNPAPNSYNTWIRSVNDIKTLAETLQDRDYEGYDEFNPDLTRADIEKAIESGTITVYSSYPIKNGGFVTPSKMEAQSYSGNGQVYQKTVNIDDVAWIDPTQGQYAEVKGTQFSLSEGTTETTPRDVYFGRIDEVYDKLKGKSAGKFYRVDGYGFIIQRNDYDESAFISVTTPEGKKLRQIVDGGNLWKNARLWHEAAKMVAKNDYPNVATASSQAEAGGEFSEIEGKDEEVKKTFKEKVVEGVSNAKNFGTKASTLLVDKYQPIEDLALKTGNRELDAKANTMRTSERAAQHFIGNGADGVRAINDLRQEVEASGLEKEFEEYMYDLLTTDRMSLEQRAKPVIDKLGKKFANLRIDQIKAIAKRTITDKTTDTTAQTIRDAQEYIRAISTRNKPVRGEFYTADIARANATMLEQKYPQFKEWANDVYANTNYMLDKLVADGELSQEAADRFRELYPHYVPIRRTNRDGKAIDVPLDTNRTGVDAPIKGATGGDGTIGYLFKTLAMRAEQTYLAGAKNRFGVELKNTLKAKTTNTDVDVDDIFDGVETHEDRLKAGENGASPTFTVFENGKRVTFEIPEDIYEALKPTPDVLKGTSSVLNAITKFQRGVLTEYNPFFMLRNAVKDFQDVIINSQHAKETYKNFPEAAKQLIDYAKGSDAKYAKEYFESGAEDLTYFNGRDKLFNSKDVENPWQEQKNSELKKVLGFVPSKISEASSFVERVPRLAEYIASRKSGASIDVAMLDAARVTTNFAAGGDITKFLNRNGATFLNASVQGAAQAVRNVREAKANGLKGMLTLGAKVVAAGLPFVLINALVWGDDEEYEELSDYIKENYYIVAKFGDGQFVRIPKGRMAAVIQNAFEQMGDLITGNDEVDLQRFGELLVENVAPNNPLENNIFAPIKNVIDNKTWYGDDLVPQRLQDLPAGEQSDETTDLISKWLGETLNVSPYKLNYLLDQYSGVFGDMFLPPLTPQAEGGNSSLLGGAIAPLTDQFTTDSVMKNQNVSDFYDTLDDLTAAAKSKYATDADTLRYKYMNSINSELSNLYKKKRELQNSNLSNSAKYNAVREIQRQIDALTEQALNSYENVKIGANGASVGGITFEKNKNGEWKKSARTSQKTISSSQYDKAMELLDDFNNRFGNN